MGTPYAKRKSQKPATRRGEGGAMPTDGLVLRFKTDEEFGRFCVSLAEEKVPFTLAGQKIVVIPGAKQLSDLPSRLAGGFETLNKMGLLDILPSIPHGKRKLPTPGEADKILEDLIKSF
jgi:hypothetical protein